MISRRIFKKKKFNIKFLFIIILIFCLSFLINIFPLNDNSDIIVIPKNNKIFYFIPEDKEGERVVNVDKKSLNLKKTNTKTSTTNIPDDLLFTIQFYVNSDFKNVKEYLSKITNNTETIYSNKDFYILALNTDIITNYFLLYKNFNSRKSAKMYCNKNLPLIANCLIVNAHKF